MKKLRVIRTIQTAITNAKLTSLPEYLYQSSHLTKFAKPDNNVIFYCINSDPMSEKWLREIDEDLAYLLCAYRESNCMEVPEMEFMLEDNYARLIKILKFTVHNFTRATTIAHLFDCHYRTMLHLRDSLCPDFCDAVVAKFSDGKNPKSQTMHDLRTLKFKFDVVEGLDPQSFLLWFFERWDIKDQWRGGILTRPKLSTSDSIDLIQTECPRIYNELMVNHYNVMLRHVSRVTDGGTMYFEWLTKVVGSLNPAIDHKENYTPKTIQEWITGKPVMVKMVGDFLRDSKVDPASWMDAVFTEELRLPSSKGRIPWLTPDDRYSNGKLVLKDVHQMSASTINLYMAQSRVMGWHETTDEFRTYCVKMSNGTMYSQNLLEIYTDIEACIRKGVYLEEVGKLLTTTWLDQMLLGAFIDKLNVDAEKFYDIPHGGGTIAHTLARMGYTAKPTKTESKKDENGYTPEELSELNRKRRMAENKRVIFQAFANVGEITVGVQEILEFSSKREAHTEFGVAFDVMYAGQLGHKMPSDLQFPSPYTEYATASREAIEAVYHVRNEIAEMANRLAHEDRVELLLYIEKIFVMLDATMLVDWDAVKTLYGIEEGEE